MSAARLLVDIRPLRESPAFRRFWAGGTLVSGTGTAMASFTIGWVVWDRTGSAAAVGLVGLAQLVPMVVFTLLGGHWADRFRRRRLLAWTAGGQAAASAALALVVALVPRAIAPLFALIALSAALSAARQPASRAVVGAMFGGDRLAAALALNQTTGQLTLLLGPLVAGVVLAAAGPAWVLGIDAVSFLAAVYGAVGLPPRPRAEASEPGVSVPAQIAAGLRFVVRTPILAGLMLADLNATVLAMPTALLPVINSERFGGSPTTLGLMLPALGIGGLFAGLLSGPVTRARRQGAVMLAGAATWAAALGAAGPARSLPLFLLLLAVAGAGDVASVVARTTLLQSVTPDELRGRVSSLDLLVGIGGPKLGDIRAGVVADATSGAFSLGIGGVFSLVLAGVVGLAVPTLRRYRTPVATV